MNHVAETGLAADSDPAKKTFGHLALHYKTPEDGPRAAKLLKLLGFKPVQEIPFGGGMVFYQFMIADDATGRGIGTIYLSMVPAPLANITAVIRDKLKVGTSEEHPAVEELRRGQEEDPEMNFHVGMMFNSLDEVERLIGLLRDANENDPDLKGRFKFAANKARPGIPDIDSRMSRSPVFSDTERMPYGKFACQAFVETDLFAGGPLGENMVLEFDFAFPGYPDNLFVKTGI